MHACLNLQLYLKCMSPHLFVEGAVLAFMLGLARFSIEECADMYRHFGSEVFRQNPLVGTVKMGWSHSYYNTETWETILRFAHKRHIKCASVFQRSKFLTS